MIFHTLPWYGSGAKFVYWLRSTPNNMSYQAAKQYLIDGNTKAALEQLGPVLEHTNLHDEWAMLRSRYRRMRESEMKGTLSSQELNLEHNRINDALLRLIDRAQDGPKASPADGGTGRTPKPRPAWLGWGLGLLLLLIVGGVLWPKLKGASKRPAKAVDTTTMDTSKEVAQSEATDTEFDEQVFDRYYIGKVVGNRDLPFDISTLGKGPRGLYLEITLRNETGQPVKLGKMELLHTGDKSKAVSETLDGEVLKAGESRAFMPKFKWAIPGEPKAFRMQLPYKVEGAVGSRRLKTDFGIYRKMD